jgi:hypothetical protein
MRLGAVPIANPFFCEAKPGTQTNKYDGNNNNNNMKKMITVLLKTGQRVVKNFRYPKMAGNLLTSRVEIGFGIRTSWRW